MVNLATDFLTIYYVRASLRKYYNLLLSFLAP